MNETTNERLGLPSASGVERLIACPGSWTMERASPPEPPSAAAEEGRFLHAILSGEEPEPDFLTGYHDSIIRRCREIEQECRQLFEFNDNITEMREERLWIHTNLSGEPRKVCSAKIDLLVMDRHRRAMVIDYKTGAGDVEDVVGNWQLRTAAVAVAEQFGAEEVYVAIAQPLGRRKLRMCRYSSADLEKARTSLLDGVGTAVEIMAATPSPEEMAMRGLLIPGEEQCRYCRAKMTCPAVVTYTITLPAAVGSPVGTSTAPSYGPAIVRMSDEDLAELLPRALVAKTVADRMISEARDRLSEGRTVPGWMLRENAPRRMIIDVMGAYNLLPETVTSEEFNEACTIAVGSLEALFAKHRPDITPEKRRSEFDCTFAAVLHSNPVRASLVRSDGDIEDDPAPEPVEAEDTK